VFDWRPSSLGNRSLNSSMNTLTTPVLLRYMVTNSRRASVSIVAGSVKEGKTIHTSQSTSVSLRRQSARSETAQCSSDSRIQEATNASVKMFAVIVMCAAVNLQSE
jgi:hypothetical protein